MFTEGKNSSLNAPRLTDKRTCELLSFLRYLRFIKALVSLYTEAELSTNWFGRSKKIVDLRQRNSTYFENLSVDGQLSLEKWLERNTQLEESGYFSTRRLDNKSVKNLVGKIIRKVGDVRIERDSALTKGSNGSFLYKGDTIETMETGATWIVLINGALVRVSPNSSISISEYIFNEKKMTFFLRLNFWRITRKIKIQK